MPKELTWDDPDDIGILLSETHPKLIRWLCASLICTVW